MTCVKIDRHQTKNYNKHDKIWLNSYEFIENFTEIYNWYEFVFTYLQILTTYV